MAGEKIHPLLVLIPPLFEKHMPELPAVDALCDVTKLVSLEGSDPTPSQELFPSCETGLFSTWP